MVLVLLLLHVGAEIATWVVVVEEGGEHLLMDLHCLQWVHPCEAGLEDVGQPGWDPMD